MIAIPPAYRSPLYIRMRVVFLVYCAIVILFLLVPILIVVPMSFNPSSFFMFPPSGVSLRWYVDFFSNPVWLGAVKNSLIISGCATVLATALGTLAALGLVELNRRWRPLVISLLVMPLAVPIVIVAVACFYFYTLLDLVGTYLGLVLAHASLGLPFVLIAVTATLQGFDRNLVRAAQNLGAGPWRAFFRVTMPLIAPGIFTGAVFAFAISFDEVVIAQFLASPEQRTLPVQIFSGTRHSIVPTVTAAASLLILLSLCLMVTALRAARRRA